MDEAAATRQAACEAIADVEPAALRDRLRTRLEAASMVPGVLVIVSAEATADGTPVMAGCETVLEPVESRAAGVQLVYEGLRLTRELAAREPWAADDATPAADRDADLEILVADVLVARGFALLARTEVSEMAVDTVQAFGRDQTVRRTTGDDSLDGNLERDILEVAAVAGATVSDATVTPAIREFAIALDDREAPAGDFPATDVFYPENVAERIGTLTAETAGNEGVTPSVDD